jgi:hypothetical protein
VKANYLAHLHALLVVLVQEGGWLRLSFDVHWFKEYALKETTFLLRLISCGFLSLLFPLFTTHESNLCYPCLFYPLILHLYDELAAYHTFMVI